MSNLGTKSDASFCQMKWKLNTSATVQGTGSSLHHLYLRQEETKSGDIFEANRPSPNPIDGRTADLELHPVQG